MTQTAQIHTLHDRVNPNLPICIVQIASVYGNTVVRPFGIVAQTFADIAGTKTLTAGTLRGVKKLGYRIVVESGGEGRGDEFIERMVR